HTVPRPRPDHGPVLGEDPGPLGERAVLARRGRREPPAGPVPGLQPGGAVRDHRRRRLPPGLVGPALGSPPSIPAPRPSDGTLMADEPIPADTSQSFVRHSAVMSVGTALSRLTGFLRVAAMAFALGIGESRLADAYNVANTTPNIVYELALGGILSSVFVPVFVEWLQTRGRDQAMRTANTVMTVTSVALGAVAVLGILLSGLIIRIYTVAVPDAERPAVEALATFFLR